MTDKVRIGVFICDCDGQIAGPLDLDEIDRKLSGLEDVVLTQQIPYGCSPYGEEAIRQGIRNSELDRVVLLGCSPRIMEKRFQTVCADAGLNPALLEIVNLRDQWAWVRKNGADHGDGKAWDLVKSGLAKARHLTPVKTITSRIHPNVAVIGGGIAGMTSALSLADRGISVTLLEKRTEITGNQAQDVRKSKHIDLLMGAEPVTVSGSYGNYEIKVKVGRRTRKVRCGAVILAMGAEEFRPHGLYGYGENDRVMTQSGLRHRLEEDPTAAAGVNHVVMIQCVGALTEERPYCGRICCLATVQNAIQLKVKNPSLSVTILYRHMVSDPGPDRSMLDRCYDLGIKFLRISQDSPPRVAPATVMGKTAEGKSFRLPYDWVVLSTPLVACDSSRHLAQAFRIPVDQFGFIPDTLPNLKPHQVTEPCVRVVGSAH
ncbi:MAG: FAD-dependent oxidoreductase, partial [Fidelibacterota bacterium]